MLQAVQVTTLENGVCVASMRVPRAHSVTLGVWLHNGARNQARGQSGYAHFLEHLFFKGAGERDTAQLAQLMEAMGGDINAFTGRELTALHGTVPAKSLETLLHVFHDMLFAPRFTDADVIAERNVVFQEMAQLEDTPDDAIEEFAVAHVWAKHPMGWPVLGRHDHLRRATAQSVQRYLAATLKRAPLTIVACGAAEHARLVERCAPFAATEKAPPAAVAVAPKFIPRRNHKHKELAQTQLLWVMPAPSATDPMRMAANLIDHALGGGSSSRLFQEVRERLGLVYDVHSRLDLYSDCGLWMIATSCEPKAARKCRAAVERVVGELCAHGLTPQEVKHASEHIEARLLVESDDPEENMERIAQELIYTGRIVEVQEHLRALHAVTLKQAQVTLAQAWQQRAFFEWGPTAGTSRQARGGSAARSAPGSTTRTD
jgi:predicted Zn-dependent peptidase